eukprot:12892045-Prorocentrum_lima.AAC.1
MTSSLVGSEMCIRDRFSSGATVSTPITSSMQRWLQVQIRLMCTADEPCLPACMAGTLPQLHRATMHSTAPLSPPHHG